MLYRSTPARFACLLVILFVSMALMQGCKVSYGFNDTGSLPASVKTVKVAQFENRAKYINPQVAPKLTEKVLQKIVGSTRLTRTNNDDADYVIRGTVTVYDATQTVSISAQQAATNRLTITVHVIWRKDQTRNREVEEFDVSRNFDYSAKSTLQQAEAQLLDEAVRSLTDDIFNKIFSNW